MSSAPPPSNAPDWEILARYLAGESPRDEAVRVESWLAQNPADRELLDVVMHQAGQVDVEAPEGLDVEGALRRVKARSGESDVAAPGVVSIEEARRRRPERVRSGFTFRVWHAAAAVAVGALGWFALRTVATKSADEPQLAVAAEYSTPAGVLDSVDLADGSRVVLAPGSRLVVPGDFASRRQVELTGAAWFRATHDDTRPFVVRAGDAYVQDVGTEFSVSSRASDSVLVQVHEGSVRVRGWSEPGTREVSLDVGDEVLVRSGSVGAVLADVVGPDGGAWTSGSMVFRDAPLDVVAAVIRRQYDFDLRIGDVELGRRLVNITVNVGELASVPHELALAVGGEVQQRGQTVIVRPATR